MVERRLIKGFNELYTIQEHLERYHSKITDGWNQVQGYVHKAFEIKSEEDCG